MTVLIPEAAGALEAGGAAEGGAAAAGSGAGDATTRVWRNPAKGAPAKKAPPAPRAKAPKAPAGANPPAVPASLRRSSTSQTYGSRAATGSPYRSGKSNLKKGAAFFKPPAMLSAGSGTAHRVVIAEFAVCVVLVGADPVLTRKPTGTHVYLANDFLRLSAVCMIFFVLALMSNSEKSSKVAAAFGGLVTAGIAFNAKQAFTALTAIFTAAASTNKAGGTVEAASAGTASVDRATYTPLDPMADPSAGAQRGSTASPASTGTTASGGVVQA